MRAHIEFLLVRYLDGKASDAERAQLSEYLASETDDAEWEGLIEELMMAEPETEDYTRRDFQPVLDGILKKKKVVRMKILRWAVAACIILLAGIGGYIVMMKEDGTTTVAETQVERFKNDVSPGSFRAKLTLADGTEVLLDTAMAGQIARQGGTIVKNENGELVYEAAKESAEMMYNTLTTARGESYHTKLSDGTKVYLNAGSSIRFPVAFIGNERRVEITGEAYFEVVHNEKMPFKVSVNGMEVHDLGTEFNVNAYSNEKAMVTTLLSGSAQVLRGNSVQLMAPGEQVEASQDKLTLVRGGDVDAATAWVKGVFRFNDIKIEALMRQMERWYDVQVVYEDKVNSHFIATIPRGTTLINALKILEQTGGVKFKVDKKIVTVFR